MLSPWWAAGAAVDAGAWRDGSRLSSPRPNTFRFSIPSPTKQLGSRGVLYRRLRCLGVFGDPTPPTDFFGQIDVCLAASRAGIIQERRLAVARRLGQTDIAWNRRLAHQVAEKSPQVRSHRLSQIGALVEHRDHDTFYQQTWI